jgi:DNA-binding CsgD family transcriptional regulator/sugar-specific transcriptional regulator TrmB
MLQALGLSPTAEGVYRAMLTSPQLGVAELCAHLSLTESQVRSSLDELVRFGLIRESREHSGQLLAVSPNIGIAAILHQQERDLAHRQSELAASKAALVDVVAEYANLLPNTGTGDAQRLVGLDAIQRKLETLAKELTTECLSVMPGGAQSQASLDASRPLDHDALQRGIAILTLYQDSVRNDPATYAYAQWMTDLGGEVRTATVLPLRMLIFDRRVAVVPIDPANTKLGVLCTRDDAIVAALTAIYERTWETAIPLGAAHEARDGGGLSATDRELLRLLGVGLTDEAAANRLGVSARTVRRQVAALMEELGARSRFEAGLKAAQRGWL